MPLRQQLVLSTKQIDMILRPAQLDCVKVDYGKSIRSSEETSQCQNAKAEVYLLAKTFTDNRYSTFFEGQASNSNKTIPNGPKPPQIFVQESSRISHCRLLDEIAEGKDLYSMQTLSSNH